jgi:hypothetical protein
MFAPEKKFFFNPHKGTCGAIGISLVKADLS